MSVYLFQLGHQPLLSRAEIHAVLQSQKNTIVTETSRGEFLLVQTKAPVSPAELIKQLGGTVKIMSLLPEVKPTAKDIANHLYISIPDGKINFSLSGAPFALTIKKELKTLERSVRYIEPKNSATILHNNLVTTASDLLIFEKKVFATTGLQDLEGFAARDYDRPKIDSKSGMLPPKLARLMVNLAGTSTDKVLLDPFCGSGTLLMEALDLGFNHLVGTDLSPKAIEHSKQNTGWILKTKKLKAEPKLAVVDVNTLSHEVPSRSIDFIATEPYMGKPQTAKTTRAELITTARELRVLYENTFREFLHVLKPGGVVVFVIPEFTFDHELIAIDCLAEIKKTGFVPVPLLPEYDSLVYKRPGQHVARRIWKFKIPA